ncbi:fatty acid--CoA ligase [Zavarzinia aquatilis]|uniref:3-methylmercaptopropionyl-CoA ligase n=1 Tax=Zavarzinia aquatilis TaxID=2211142 RepID=A0A317DWS2_9PROT|nr:fatty acid--CoA ligase [Zavarzinia aquatilis]PWR18400.1 acyl-CoA synthetase [Zavarzinia aquatilis]
MAVTDGLIRTVGDIPRHHAARQPEATALVFEGRRSSFARWNDRCSQVANALIRDGAGSGARVVFFAKNSDWYYEAYVGATKANAVLVAVNWRLAPPEVAYIVNDSAAEILMVGPEFLPLIREIRADLPRVRRIVVMGEGGEDGPGWEDWLAGVPTDDPQLPTATDDVAIQLYTSGTTGHPKGVMLTNGNVLEAMKAAENGTYGPWRPGRDSLLMCMPNFHVAGSNWGLFGLSVGVAVHVLAEVDPARILATIEREKISRALFVPAVVLFLVQHPAARTTDVSSLKTILYGAAPIPLDLLRAAMEVFDCDFVQGYGLTETCGATICLPPADHDPAGNPRMRSCGKPLPGVEVRIVDALGKALPPGEVGEIVIRSALNMIGYWGRPEETAKTLRDGWLHTGDAGYTDADGYVYIHDRVKDMIVSGAENIYPAEVESALYGHPAIADVAVIGVPDERWGEAVKAVVVLKPGQDAAAADIIAFARQRIAAYKAPKTVDFVDSLPRNPSGKLLKRELRKPYWEGRDRQVN